MSGLIYKDICNLKRYIRQLLLIILAMTVLSSLQGSSSISFLSSYTVLLCAMVVISSLSYDDYAKWDKYALTMPISRKTLVGSKYVLGILCGLAGTVLSPALAVVSQLISQSAPDSVLELLLTLGVMFCVCLLILSVILPLLFKFGAEKARMMILVVVPLPAAVGLILSRAGVPMPSESAIERLLMAIPFIAVAAFALSFFISVGIMERKEF